jgi:hypothetical protein
VVTVPSRSTIDGEFPASLHEIHCG